MDFCSVVAGNVGCMQGWQQASTVHAAACSLIVVVDSIVVWGCTHSRLGCIFLQKHSRSASLVHISSGTTVAVDRLAVVPRMGWEMMGSDVT